MRLPMIAASFGMVFTASVAQAAPPRVEIKDAVVRVTVIPEARGDIKVEFLSTNSKLPLHMRTSNGKVMIDGDLDRKIRSCEGQGAGVRVQVAGLGQVAYADMPQVVIRTPRDVDIQTGGAVYGAVGKSTNMELSNAGCGDWIIANVSDQLKLTQAGSGDTFTGSAKGAVIHAAGSGDIKTMAVNGPLEISIAGSGDVRAASVEGSLNIKAAGSGDVKVAAGRVDAMNVAVAGSGDVDFRGVAQTLKARIAGSGDVRVREVKGAVSKTIMGSGAVTIG
ncbi:MAG: DUF2807 domain-containing protein [Phenylobacterium sp.]|uniref:GIN domain-containing protein n=1 Tax=Phenylobacterium sp. TaxID=1871053 RepID=UPI00272045C4|nr:DUF2807 domain-containing protein [Phenylobacterium sp.]MDO9431870.1 DUF2807 domain-containing protein [Phenylobacterium sp.]